jgi:hypothetical protein
MPLYEGLGQTNTSPGPPKCMYTVSGQTWEIYPKRRLMPTRTAIPKFKSESEEAQWWDAHPGIVTALFLKAKNEGRFERLPRIRSGVGVQTQ